MDIHGGLILLYFFFELLHFPFSIQTHTGTIAVTVGYLVPSQRGRSKKEAGPERDSPSYFHSNPVFCKDTIPVKIPVVLPLARTPVLAGVLQGY